MAVCNLSFISQSSLKDPEDIIIYSWIDLPSHQVQSDHDAARGRIKIAKCFHPAFDPKEPRCAYKQAQRTIASKHCRQLQSDKESPATAETE